MPHDKHWDLGSILALIPDLCRNEILGGKTLDFGSPQQPPLLRFLQGIVETILINERRIGEARKDGEEPRIFSLSPDRGLSNEILSESSDTCPVLKVMDVDLVFDLTSNHQYPPTTFHSGERPTHVFLVHGDEVIFYQRPHNEL